MSHGIFLKIARLLGFHLPLSLPLSLSLSLIDALSFAELSLITRKPFAANVFLCSLVREVNKKL